MAANVSKGCPLFNTKMQCLGIEALHPAIDKTLFGGSWVISDETRKGDMTIHSIFSLNNAEVRLHPAVINALWGIAKKRLTLVNASDPESKTATYVAEVPFRNSDGKASDTKFLVVSLSGNGSFKGSVCVPSADANNVVPSVSPLPAVGSKEMTTTPTFPLEGLYAPSILFALDLEKSEKKGPRQMCEVYEKLIEAFKNDSDFSENGPNKALRENLFLFCDYIWWSSKRTNTGVPTPEIPETLTIDTLSKEEFATRSVCGDVVAGSETPTILNRKGNKNFKRIKTFKDCLDAFEDYRVPLSDIPEEDRKFIPQFPDDLRVPKPVVTMLYYSMATENDREPARNFYWRGETGIGKSMGAAIYAAVRGLPLMRLTCSPTMETQDFLASYVPCGSGEKKRLPKLPPLDYIEVEPEASYRLVTGQDLEGATPQDVLDAYTEMATQQQPGSSAMFKLVESPFIKALVNGYVVEVQELSCIRDPGVMLSLNEYDHPGAFVPLVDGRMVQRHRRAIMIATDNPGYQGTNPVNQAVLRRFAFVEDTWTLSKEDALERVKYNTEFEDMSLLEQMYDIWEGIRKVCSVNGYDEGETSIVALENWAKMLRANIPGTTRRSTCMSCLVGKATARPDEQRKIVAEVLDKNAFFGKR